MEMLFSPELTSRDRAELTRMLAPFPDTVQVKVYRPSEGRYSLWFRKGTLTQLMITRNPVADLLDLEEEIVMWARNAVRTFDLQDPGGQETNHEPTRADYLKARLDGLERSLGPRGAREYVERGQAPDLTED